MTVTAGIVCGKCDRLNPLDSPRCAECENALALSGSDGQREVDAADTAEEETGSAKRERETVNEPPEAAIQGTEGELMEQARHYICKSCYSPVPVGHKFCGKCGTPVPEEAMHPADPNYFGDLQAPGKAKLILIKGEGMDGISPRYIQDKISNALVSEAEGCLNPFMVLNELGKGLRSHSLINSEEKRTHYGELISVVKQEYEEIVKNEVQRAISADEEAIGALAMNYIDNVKAYTLKEKVRNRYTGTDEAPDERLMRSIEEKIDIADSRKDDFRREIMNFIGALAVEGKEFRWDANDRLRRALEMKLFEDQKDSIKLSSLVSQVIDKDTQEKIDVVKTRMKQKYGYCEICATDVLNFVASIFARGDARSES